ncbi:putative Maf-like protein, partial [Corynebacterium glucuronolyticum ATCC 51866]
NGETPLAVATRLATAKAAEVAARYPGAWVIGSDQVADLNGRPLGKPGTAEAACAQLAAMSGQTVRFHTAISLTRDGESL